jgi:hypothetical protein
MKSHHWFIIAACATGLYLIYRLINGDELKLMMPFTLSIQPTEPAHVAPAANDPLRTGSTADMASNIDTVPATDPAFMVQNNRSDASQTFVDDLKATQQAASTARYLDPNQGIMN